MASRSHIDLSQLWIYNRSLCETSVRTTSDGEVRKELRDGLGGYVKGIHIREVLIISLAPEDEQGLTLGVKNHRVT